MNREQIARKVAGCIEGATIKDTRLMVNTIFEVIKETLESGESVSVYGFGNFNIVTQGGRVGYINFGEKKGEKYVSPDKKVVRFKPSETMKNNIATLEVEGGEK